MVDEFDKAIADTGLTVGGVFAEKYRIDRVLGVGGMGCVLGATHLQLAERVAIKVLLAERAKDPEIVTRFLREGRAAVRIRSEHVARILDVGSAAGTPYIVMEYLDGCDLADLLRRRKRMPVALAVDYLLQACEAIAEAHAMHTVHRDLKPANLFVVQRLDGSDCIKVLDFGISKSLIAGGEDASMTRTTSMLGTPLYMSPEQLKSSKNTDVRTDIWALGVVLFEMIAGRTPFRADSIAELSAKILTSDAPDLRKYVPETPAGLAEALGRCLRRHARERISSVAELAAAIAPFGTLAARASSDRIAQVLSGVPRVESSPEIELELAETSGTGSLRPPSTTMGVTSPMPSLSIDRPARSTAKWIVAGAVGLTILGAGGGIALRKLVATPGQRVVAGAQDAGAATSASATTSVAITPVAIKKATLNVTLPAGATLRVGPEDWTSKVSSDGKLELSGPARSVFRIAIYLGKKQIVSQDHVLFDDGVLEPPDLDAGKTEQSPSVAVAPSGPRPVRAPGGASPASGAPAAKSPDPPAAPTTKKAVPAMDTRPE